MRQRKEARNRKEVKLYLSAADDNIKKQRAAKLSIYSNITLTLAKIIVGFISGSVGILSEAIHSAMDLVASFIAYFSIKAASEPADAEHPYGHGKYEDVAGLAEAVLIFIIVIVILHESVSRLLGQEGFHIEVDLGIVVMLIATIANILVSNHLFKVSKETDSIALYADAQHLRTDVYTSAGVLLSLIMVKITGFMWIDPVSAILVALFISYIAFKISKDSIDKLVDVSLPVEDEAKIKEVLHRYSDEIISVHKFRSRKSGSNRFIEFHIIVEGNLTIKEGHLLCDLIEQDIKLILKNTYISIHIEPCTDDCEVCHLYYTSPETCSKIETNKSNA
ncbi:MAG: cation diffusion facilitator family transporter [Cyanobacteriota bacterium]